MAIVILVMNNFPLIYDLMKITAAAFAQASDMFRNTAANVFCVLKTNRLYAKKSAEHAVASLSTKNANSR